MRKVHGLPPNFEEIVKGLGFRPEGMLFTYGDTIYAEKSLLDITADIEVHEQVHMLQQQAITPAKWWERYLANPQFRLQQEIDAYRVQYRWACDHMRDPRDRAYMLRYVVNAMTTKYGLQIRAGAVERLMMRARAA